jgi:hypothetical protein
MVAGLRRNGSTSLTDIVEPLAETVDPISNIRFGHGSANSPTWVDIGHVRRFLDELTARVVLRKKLIKYWKYY